MRLVDKIALNRLIAIFTNFILALVKIFKPDVDDNPKPIPDVKPRPRIFPWRRKKQDENN